MKIHQDTELYLAAFSKGQQLSYRLKPSRQAWLQVTRGAAVLNETSLAAGDGAAVSKEELLQIQSSDESEVLLFDLP
jgi:redox-sensitive bicupin YhaK (pirin superfamily)